MLSLTRRTITSGEPLMRGGGLDQGVERRPDVLVFQTEPLMVDIEVTGAIEASLWISSDAVDADFTINHPSHVVLPLIVGRPT